MTEQNSRRKFISGTARCALGIVSISGVFHACGGNTASNEKDPNVDPCTDFSDVPESDLKLRKSLGYVESSPQEESQCNNCNLWLPISEESPCGKCTLFKGPVLAEGYCTYWAPQVQG